MDTVPEFYTKAPHATVS